jgi:hypothetical protein
MKRPLRPLATLCVLAVPSMLIGTLVYADAYSYAREFIVGTHRTVRYECPPSSSCLHVESANAGTNNPWHRQGIQSQSFGQDAKARTGFSLQDHSPSYCSNMTASLYRYRRPSSKLVVTETCPPSGYYYVDSDTYVHHSCGAGQTGFVGALEVDHGNDTSFLPAYSAWWAYYTRIYTANYDTMTISDEKFTCYNIWWLYP